ncbi:MAG: hypothetical protein K2I46_04625 [Clostridia bacterium]|nr:hypothetical protein [Clostridia bacterium]
MKKISIILIICLAVCLGALITGCNPSFGPVGTTEFKDSPVVNNGGLVVQQGGYIYYVNGMDSTSNITKPDDNAFGKASVKGSIMKSRIDEKGNLSETAVVVPKMFYTSASNGGFYIYGEWIYYMSPNTKTDNKSNVLNTQSVAFRTKIDGTKTQEIATITANSTQYIFTENALIYFEDSTLKKVGYTDSKVNKKSEDIVTGVDSALFTAKSDVIFYVKSTGASNRLNNNMYAYVNGEIKEITSDTTYDEPDGESSNVNKFKKQYTFALLSYDADSKTLFYTKVGNDNDANKKTSTYAYTFDENFNFEPAKEVRYSTSALTASSIYYLGADKGILYTADATLQIYKPISETAIKDDTQDYVTIKTTGLEIVKIENNDIYYILSNTLYKINVEEAVEQKLSEDAISTSWLTRSVIGDYLYYIDNTYNYMYRVDLTAYNFQDHKEEFAKGEIVSGTRKATLTKNDDDKIVIKYVSDDANEDGVKYYQIPKFMTSDDAQKYAEAIYEDEED